MDSGVADEAVGSVEDHTHTQRPPNLLTNDKSSKGVRAGDWRRMQFNCGAAQGRAKQQERFREPDRKPRKASGFFRRRRAVFRCSEWRVPAEHIR
ncbi:hypothetical protein Scep_028416 [Stephania cephalantha]|uniref:Uncharacterized protein n=1 Tax=Stephania cephalantha TaxID=152367 RepID=A0AAP0EIB1_9MAGN